jgi:hypothetical protein
MKTTDDSEVRKLSWQSKLRPGADRGCLSRLAMKWKFEGDPCMRAQRHNRSFQRQAAINDHCKPLKTISIRRDGGE